ncbi:MAG TPA: hypothetical protein DDZ51_28375, partial [Planctomycetaceae bacterium]|nr:hypothetical protein [Planctomycetaceae bacterium]
VVDSGIDPKHPDLYLNIWINQGEIPADFLDDVGNKLVDIDGDGLITFYDLNNLMRDSDDRIVVASTGVLATQAELTTATPRATGQNAEFVRDLNNNGRIDADDLLRDARWTSGTDDDGNGFFDDIFGVNFRAGAGDPFASNNPTDELGHGTHVAGTIGAIGNNGTGVVGVNWQTSLMSLRILDNNNQGDSGAAIRAINYARDMRERLTINSANRVTEGANVRVLNNSWGQPGGYEASLEAAIQQLYGAGILFVAAAGNGNILGNGVDNDRTPFYPASYNVPNVIAVAAADANDRLATFSNFGKTSVDILAPGVGIRSTVPGGGYQSANGTSMAAPHVAGTAALIWSALPGSTVDEVKQAILSTTIAAAQPNIVATNGRLNAHAAINADVFAPAARLIAKQDITTSGGTTTEFTIEYSHRDGIDITTIGDDDIIVTRQWGPRERINATLKPGSVTKTTTTAVATYFVSAPGGTWDARDYGGYQITTQAGKIQASVSSKSVQTREIGSFNVKILYDPQILYVSQYNDTLGSNTLRSAILSANAAAPAHRTIILESGNYTIDIRPEIDTSSTFDNAIDALGIINPGGWSSEASGDFIVSGSITIIGDTSATTAISGNSLDRVFRVFPSGSLELVRIAVTSGKSPADQGGGGILSVGELIIRDSVVSNNTATSTLAGIPARGGGVAVWNGSAEILQSTIDSNEANFGGGLFYDGTAHGRISRSTISNNKGGGVSSHSTGNISVDNSTISSNIGGAGALYNGLRDGFTSGDNDSFDVSISLDGRYTAFSSLSSNLSYKDLNSSRDIFLYDAQNERTLNVTNGLSSSSSPAISGDGKFIVFSSFATNQPSDSFSNVEQILIYDIETRTFDRISKGIDGAPANGRSWLPTVNRDGRFVGFSSTANNLVAGTTGNLRRFYIYDRLLNTTRLVGDATSQNDTLSFSNDGRLVVFSSPDAPHLDPSDINGVADIYIFDIDAVASAYKRVTAGTVDSHDPSVSGDGNWVLFHTGGTFANPGAHVYLHDVDLSHNTLFAQNGNMNTPPRISNDGTVIAYFGQGVLNVAIRETKAAAQYELGNSVNRGLFSLDESGGVVAFSSKLSDLVKGDSNNRADVFLLRPNSGLIESPTVRTLGSPLAVKNSTVVKNLGAIYAISGNVTMENSIVAGNTSTIEVGPFVESSNYNLFATSPFEKTLKPEDQVVKDAISYIGPLVATKEGNQAVHRLLKGSTAIDQGNPLAVTDVDQLGQIRSVPDVGASEAVSGKIAGRVALTAVSAIESSSLSQGIPGVLVFLDEDLDGVFDESERFAITSTGSEEVSGAFEFVDVIPGNYRLTTIAPDSFAVQADILSRAQAHSVEPNGRSTFASSSDDGNVVVFASLATNLDPSLTDGNSFFDVFLYERRNASIIQLSRGINNGTSNGHTSLTSGPQVSRDGARIVFESEASNLVSNDRNGTLSSVFLYEKGAGIRLLANEASMQYRRPAISGDGRVVAYVSGRDVFVQDVDDGQSRKVATFGHPLIRNLSLSNDGGQLSLAVVSDSGMGENVYLVNTGTGAISVASRTASNSPANGYSSNGSISSDGRYITFHSDATNLVTGKSGLSIYRYDVVSQKMEWIAFGINPSMSGDGRFVAFTNGSSDPGIKVIDLSTGTIKRIDTEAGFTGQSSLPRFSIDGKFVAFESSSNRLLGAGSDNNNEVDVFIAPNPFLPPSLSLSISAGEEFFDVEIAVIANAGEIRGKVFEDAVANGIYDSGEPLIQSVRVFVDLNGNGSFDNNEQSVVTDASGAFAFTGIATYREYTLKAVPPVGFEIASPSISDDFTWKIFVPAGGTIGERDFAIRQIQSTGQSSSSGLSGRLFIDNDRDGVFSPGDEPIRYKEVYLDASNFGIRDASEPRTLTDGEGGYSFSGLSARNVAVTTVLDETLVHVNPLGSKFTLEKQPLFAGVTPFGNPQAIASGDFNNDGFLDVAVALGEANKLSIRLNDGKGGFLPEEIDIDLGTTGAGPTSLVVGQFDNDTKLDVALTANFTGNVTILRNFDAAKKGFGSIAYVKVGNEPIDIAAGQFGGDVKPDLVVVNKAANTVQVLTNNGSGVFTAGPARATGGKNSSSIVVGNFTGDASLDVAVVHASPLTTANPFGGVTLLRGNGAGGLTLVPGYYTVGATPTDAVVGDFNKDGRPDIAVSNFATNSISILLGQADGTLRVQTSILGTASGAFDLTVGDIDNDGDIDVIASNLRDRNISIFRNIGVVGGEVQFEPLENVGLGQFSLAQRMPLVVGNFDNDTSGPNGTGTIDIVTIPQRTDTLHVLTNTLVNGAHRVALTGLATDVRNNLDFIIKPAILPPSFDFVADPLPIFEDAAVQSITISNIVKGRPAELEPLRLTVTSDNPALIPSPGLLEFTGGSNKTFSYTPMPNMNGIAVLTVQAIDAGADGDFGGADDGIFERSFTVSVLAVNDPPVFNLLAEATARQTDGATTIVNFVTGMGNGGGADEVSQTRDPLVVTASDPSFFTVQPAINAAGTLSFTPNPNKSGSVPVTVTLKDSGGRANGGVDTTTKTFLVIIGPVNDPPSFTLMASPNRNVLQTAGPQTINNFVTSFAPGGGPDEATQTVSDYIVTVDAPGIFAVLPDISNAGTLTFTPAIDRTGVATVSVQVRDSGGRVNGGDDLSAVTTFTITVTPVPDTTRPTPVITPSVPLLTNQSTFDIEVDFKEPMSEGTFTLSDFTASQGTISDRRDLGGGKFVFAYTAAGQGAVTFGVAANVATDLAGNQNLAATSVTRTIDTVGFTPTLSTTTAALSNVTSFVVTIAFGEPAIGFTLDDIVVLNGTASNLVTVNAAIGSYTATITPTADGTVTVLLPAGSVTDVAGNGNAAATPLVRTVDRTAPVAVLSTTEPSRTNKTTFDVIAEFGETVTGLAANDLTIQGGTAGAPVLLSPGRYRFPITATNGPVQIQLVASAVTDAAGNANAASNTINLTVDTTAFVPVLSSTSSAVLNTDTFNVAVDFGKAVASFTAANITLSGGTASNITTVDAASGKYSFTVTATGDGSVTVLVAAGVVRDTAGNSNAASNSLVRTVDRVAPRPTLSANVPALTNQASFIITIDFGKEVTGFTLSDIVTTGATLSSPQSLGAGRFTATATSSGGPATFNIPASAAHDLAGNTSLAATTLALTVDLSAPLPLLTTTAPARSNAASFTVAANFGEEVVGFVQSDVLLINGVASGFTEVNRDTGSYTFVVTPSSDGVVSVLVPAGSATDRAGNLTLASSLLSRSFDRQMAIPVLTTTEPARTNKTTFEVIANFGEVVTGLTQSDFQVTGGTLGNPVDLGGGRYALTISGASGLVEVQVNAGAVTDAAGNTNLASAKLSVTVDTAALIPVLSSTSTNLLNTNTFDVTVVFGKQVNNFAATNITLLGGTASNFVVADAASGRYTFTVTATNDGNVTVLVAAGVVSDAAGNLNAASNTLVRTIDRGRPQPVLSVPFTGVTNLSTFDLTVDFAEQVTGFDLADIVATGATLSNFRSVGGGRYLATATAANGPVTFAVAGSVAADLAGNQNLAAATLSRTVDTVGVTATLSSTAPSLTNAATIPLAISFGEPVVGFTLSDLTVLGGTASNLMTVNAATGSFTATVTPTADGTVTVLLPAGLVTDAAGNGNSVTVPLIRTVDRTSPTVTLTTNEPERTNRTTFDVFAQFSEPVTGLARAGLNISGGTASDPIFVSPGLYRFTITASVGAVQMQLVAAAANDLAGNASQASSALTITVDPAVVFTPTVSSTSATILNTATFNAAVNFGTQVNGFTLDDIVVVNGLASNLTTMDPATGRYAFTVNATADGQVSVLLPAGIANDLSRNANSASNTLVRIVDRVAPQPTLSVNVPSLTNQSNFVLTVEFGEEVTGFALGDVVVSGASLSALQHLGGGRYTMNVTATHGSASFNLPAGIANDLAGNPNVAATQVSLQVDTSSPRPTLTTTAPALSNAASFTVAANFGEEVVGFAIGELLLINGVASNLIEVNRATGSYSFVVTPSSDGVVSVLVPAGSATDRAGNLTLASSLLSRSFDRQVAVPVLTTTEPARTNKTTFEVIANFGEVVTGLTQSDFQVTGGTIGNPVDLGGGRYALTISGASGLVEVQVKAAAVTDAAGNTNLASEKLSITVDTSALIPVLSSTSTSLINANTFDVTVVFGKQVNGFAANKVTLLGGTASNFVEADAANGRYTFTVTASADGNVTVLVAAGVVSDAAGNLNAASNSLVRTIDRARPQPVLSVPFTGVTNSTTFDLTVDFAEEVTGFELVDIVATGATLSNFRSVGGGRYLATATAANGPVTFAVAGSVAADLAGNQNLAAATLSRTVDTVGVTATLSSTAPSLTNAATIPLAISFGEPVVGFTLSDLTVLGGTASNLITVNAATGSFAATITPTADGTVTVLLPAGLVTDLAGNSNSATVPLIRTVDRTSPTVTLTTNEPERTNRTTFDVFARFNESVAGLTKAGLNISGGTASDPIFVSPGLYRFTITASVGAVQMQVVAAAANDLAGNASQASSALTITVDPAVVFTPAVSSTSATILNTATFSAAVNFGTQVNGFTLDDIVVVNGIASNLVPVDVATGRYSFTVTAAADGQVSVLISAGVASDLAGNANSASNTLVRMIDRVAPQPRLSVNVPSL